MLPGICTYSLSCTAFLAQLVHASSGCKGAWTNRTSLFLSRGAHDKITEQFNVKAHSYNNVPTLLKLQSTVQNSTSRVPISYGGGATVARAGTDGGAAVPVPNMGMPYGPVGPQSDPGSLFHRQYPLCTPG
jgi:hypothetical protein